MCERNCGSGKTHPLKAVLMFGFVAAMDRGLFTESVCPGIGEHSSFVLNHYSLAKLLSNCTSFTM